MITTASEMQAALRKATFAGVILYEGPSMIDGSPIVVIANRITARSKNEKTGAMVQTFIIRSDVDPVTALKTGDDASVCGDCPHRPANDGTCYVRVFQSVASTFKAFKRNRYARPGVDYDVKITADLFRGLAFRMGSYGDPAAAPFMIWRRATVHAAAVNGYTHQWREVEFQAFRLLCMASADSLADMEEAHAMGWRTFRVRAAHEPVTAKREVICPASQEAGQRTSCLDCKACGGLSAKAKVSMVIIAHGATAKRFATAA
ncbi:hypothetical protein NKI13_18550 [Mesorhizobium australicum]|uniref:hypothetical protein n=1 Tax=Mesorhizobium australicum TaxID=536018 RepID=UPI0033354EEA